MLKKVSKLLNDNGFKLLLKDKRFDLFYDMLKERLEKKVEKEKHNISFDVNFSKLENITYLKMENKREENYTLELTGFKVNLTKDIFYLNFTDEESLFSVYRFRWLLLGIETYKDNGFAEEAIDVINYWLDNYDSLVLKVNETYSICERLLNILYFISIVKYNNVKELDKLNIHKLSKIFKLQINDILNNIENRGKYTNNHILNNARALYILGGLLKIDNIGSMGKDLLFSYFDILIKNGILLEGSFHYQVLLTRSMCEIYLVAKQIKDNQMIKFLFGELDKMLFYSSSLHSNFSSLYPLIGDISPDFPVEFFSGYPFSKQDNESSKWNNIFNFSFDFSKDQKYNSEFKFWEKYNYGDIEIWMINKKDGILPHGHNDNGSFTIFYKGKPILIDTGRYTYRRYHQNSNMTNTLSHTGIIYKTEIDIDRQSIFSKSFNKYSVIKIEQNSNHINVNIEDYTKRYNYLYSLVIEENRVIIETQNEINLFVNEQDLTMKLDSFIVDDLEIVLKDKKLLFDKAISSNNYGFFNSVVNIKGVI